jgi:hypothetical protein
MEHKKKKRERLLKKGKKKEEEKEKLQQSHKKGEVNILRGEKDFNFKNILLDVIPFPPPSIIPF